MTRPRITPKMIRALAAPPMAGGVSRSMLVWRDGRAVVTDADDVMARGGRIVCCRNDLLDAGLPERRDGSIGGPVAAFARTLAAVCDADLADALGSDGKATNGPA